MANIKGGPLIVEDMGRVKKPHLLYWAVRELCELEMRGTSLANRFGLSQPGLVYAVPEGEKIGKEETINCSNKLLIYKWTSRSPPRNSLVVLSIREDT